MVRLGSRLGWSVSRSGGSREVGQGGWHGRSSYGRSVMKIFLTEFFFFPQLIERVYQMNVQVCLMSMRSF